MNAAGITDPHDIGKVRALGVIDLPTIQKKLNLHYTLSLDLFGGEVSTNAANAFNAGIKGRFRETKIDDDHRLENATYPVVEIRDGIKEGDRVVLNPMVIVDPRCSRINKVPRHVSTRRFSRSMAR